MATPEPDPLLLLRNSIASETHCIPTTTDDASAASSVNLSLATATFLQFPSASVSIPLTTPTRFISSNKPVDLRSIYFAWLKRETAIPEYNASALSLNAELAAEGGAGGEVQNLAFVERLDLITWLEGASEESEYIKPLASDVSSAAASAQVASGIKGGIAPVTSAAGRQGKSIDPRLAEIYNGERRMGDRNSVLRGIKPTVYQVPGVLTKTTNFAYRTFHMLESSQHHSTPGKLPTQQQQMPQAVHLYLTTLKLQSGVPTPSSCSLHPPPRCSACQTSSLSSRTGSTSRPIPRPRHLALLHRFCTSRVFCLPSILRGRFASSLSIPRSSLSQSIGRGLLLCLPQVRSGSSRATSGRHRKNCSETRWGCILGGGEISYLTQ